MTAYLIRKTSKRPTRAHRTTDNQTAYCGRAGGVQAGKRGWVLAVDYVPAIAEECEYCRWKWSKEYEGKR